MFKKYFLIYYDNLNLTLAKYGIKMENWEKMENKPKLYPKTEIFSTRCNKKELISLVNAMNSCKGIEVQHVLKIDRYCCPFEKFISYFVLKERLMELLSRQM